MNTMQRRAFLISGLAAGYVRAADGPVAETRQGKVRGGEVNGVRIFRGLPYGGPSEGAGRFLPASKPQKWAGVRDATVTGPRCTQGGSNIFLDARLGEYFGGGRADRVALAQQTESENCLVLNVLTNGLRGKRPVMVYIHGGGFTNGSGLLGLYSDAFVREQDVVVVSVNHRINVFGYLHLGELSPKYPDSGNIGQLDLIAALEWVRDNIAAFGGDPANVTVFGESGGGAKISALLAMPGAKGLFHRAIVESGSALQVATRDDADKRTRAVMDKLGLGPSRVDELQRVPADKLLAAGRGMNPSPVLDGRSIPAQTWTPGAPAVSATVPMIIGYCKDEQTLFSLQDTALYSLDEAGLRDRAAKAGVPEKLIAAYRTDYPKETPTDLWFRMVTDRGTGRNALVQAERRAEQGKAPVYLYYFAWNTPLVDGKIKAFHTAELPLAMRLVRYPESEQLSRQISAAWATFARTGNPNHKGLPAWPAFDTTGRATMVLDAPASAVVKDRDREERLIINEQSL
jgi:para-nitrobenzyl esterase